MEKQIEFKVMFGTEFGNPTVTRKADLELADPEEQFRIILRSLPIKMSLTWDCITFELGNNEFEVASHHFVETNYNFWQSVTMTELIND